MMPELWGADRAWWLGRSSKPRRRRLRRLRWVRFPHAPATLTVAWLAMLILGVIGQLPTASAQDSINAPPPAPKPAAADSQPALDSVRRGVPSPMGALWSSFLIPGWGQAKLNRKLTGGIFIAWEGVTLGMALKTRQELAYLRRTNSARGDSKRQEHEDWLVLLAFNHVLAGLEAYVSAHLSDFPEDLRFRGVPVPGGAAATLSLPFRIR